MNKISFLLIFLIFSHTVYGQSDSLKLNKTYLGSNITRMTVGDFELEIMHRLNDYFMVGIAGGYDVNFLDQESKNSKGKKETHDSESKEDMSNPQSRYIWGNGFSGRLHIDYTFPSSHDRQHFISLEGLWKKRDYSDHYFGEERIVHLESAEQTIEGITLYYGTNYKIKKHLTIRFHTGAGIRILNSHITRPGYNFDLRYWPATELNYKLVIPTLHLGLTILVGL